MDESTQIIVLASVLGGAWLVLSVVVLVLCCQLGRVRKQLTEMQNNSRPRVQKLKLNNNDLNHAFYNPALVPDEELSRRGYSMYMGQNLNDVESGNRGTTERQERRPDGQTNIGGSAAMDDLIDELDNRNNRQQNTTPPFLLQSIKDNKMKNRNTMNPLANGSGRPSDNNPNFIY